MPRGTWQNNSETEKSRQPTQVHHGASCRQWELNPTGDFGTGAGISRYPSCEVGVPTGLWWRDANPGTSGLLPTQEQ